MNMAIAPAPVRTGTTTAYRESVYSNFRDVGSPQLELTDGLEFDSRLEMDGIEFLDLLPDASVPAAFFDPQYRGILDKLSYGNEGKSRCRKRSELVQMPEVLIKEFIHSIARVLTPSGHLFLWTDKYHLCTGLNEWHGETELQTVDLVTWQKPRIGMGYRTRRKCEFLVVMQKLPLRAKGVWTVHNIPDVWNEDSAPKGWPHRKPVGLQQRLIEAVTGPDEVVIDPAAGSFSVMEACLNSGRRFLGCDLNG